jgi:large subunit ribosomal protein L10
MSKTRENKAEVISDLKQLLQDSQLAVVIDYQGLTVAEITDLRKRLRESGSICKVTKNTLMQQAIKDDANWQPMTDFLKGTSAFILVKDDFGNAIKAYQAFQKESKKTEIRGGVLEGKLLSQKDVKAIADLPSKEQLIARIAGAINGVATKLARGINEVPASLARGIQAIVDKEKEEDKAA